MRIIILLVCACLLSGVAYSKTCTRIDENGVKIKYACKEPEKRYRISYDIETTRRNNKITRKRIVPESVCTNYGSGSIERRECLVQARDKFKHQCRDYKERYDSATYRADQIKLERDMFCEAVETLRFVR